MSPQWYLCHEQLMLCVHELEYHIGSCAGNVLSTAALLAYHLGEPERCLFLSTSKLLQQFNDQVLFPTDEYVLRIARY